jgi:hypothetical protein
MPDLHQYHLALSTSSNQQQKLKLCLKPLHVRSPTNHSLEHPHFDNKEHPAQVPLSKKKKLNKDKLQAIVDLMCVGEYVHLELYISFSWEKAVEQSRNRNFRTPPTMTWFQKENDRPTESSGRRNILPTHGLRLNTPSQLNITE